MFYKNTVEVVFNVIEMHADRNAFCINEKYYTYREFADSILKIRTALQNSNNQSKRVGLIDNDDIETYASIFALWLEGCAYVPISSDAPIARNEDIIGQAAISTIIDSSGETTFSKYNLIKSSELTDSNSNLIPNIVNEEELAYILFTSGSTGNPKGVQISRSNLSAFVMAFQELDVDITFEDKCLQMFNLTFDLSIISYLLPLLKGACVYTVPKKAIKYSYVFKLLDESNISITMMVPSMVQYLRPYFEEMHFPAVKYSMFCGEALNLKLMEEWSVCVPNAKILNVYGPTENTIICTNYEYSGKESLCYNGVLSIGKSFGQTDLLILDENDNVLPNGNKGELCLISNQLTSGYLNNEKKNKEVFFSKIIDGKSQRIYRTGDLCYVNDDGFIFYVERIDFQTKIQGFRVELSEVEFHAKTYLDNINVVALAIENRIGNNEIGLVIESKKIDTIALFEHLKSKMPPYMIPTQLKFESNFPLNSNGKIDKNILKNNFISNN